MFFGALRGRMREILLICLRADGWGNSEIASRARRKRRNERPSNLELPRIIKDDKENKAIIKRIILYLYECAVGRWKSVERSKRSVVNRP